LANITRLHMQLYFLRQTVETRSFPLSHVGITWTSLRIHLLWKPANARQWRFCSFTVLCTLRGNL